MTEDETPEGSSARQRIEESLENVLDRETLDLLLKEVLAGEKPIRTWCPSCKKAVHTSIPDAKAVVAAMSELLTQGFGRPAQQASEDEQAVHVSYTVLVQHPDGSTKEVLPVGARDTTSTNGATE